MGNKTTDIKSAFLQDKELDREVYLRPPVESHTPSNIIWKLKHGLYGLKDEARRFFISVKEELLKLDYQVSICSLIPPATAISKTQDRADTSVWWKLPFSIFFIICYVQNAIIK